MLTEIKEILDGLLAASGNLAQVADIGAAYSYVAEAAPDPATGKRIMRAVADGKCVYLTAPLTNKTAFRHAFDQTGRQYDLRIADDGQSFSLYPIRAALPFVAPVPR
ncbi:MAG: hypothetical protein IPM39_29445 [Chloroflexi bacterium]|nr:hypothetical protein [Chloroflexota bacterium]